MNLDLASLATTWHYPTTVLFGAGSVRKLAKACESAGLKRPLVVTDTGLAKLPVIERVLGLLREAGPGSGLFADRRPSPVAANVEAGVAALHAGGHDGVVAVGGGSGLDTGKCVAFMVGQTRPMWDFEDKGDWYKRADPAGIRPIVAVPTT